LKHPRFSVTLIMESVPLGGSSISGRKHHVR
jgi:hypothetical protein